MSDQASDPARDPPLPKEILPAESVDESGSPLVEEAPPAATGGTEQPGHADDDKA